MLDGRLRRKGSKVNAIIDTNILYYIAEIGKPCDLDPKKLLAELLSFESVQVSELTILEMFVHFRNEKRTIVKLIDFLVDKGIGANKILNQKYAFVDKDIIIAMQNKFIFDYVVDDSARIKKEIENGYLRFWIFSIAAVYTATKLADEFGEMGFNSPGFLKAYTEIVINLSSESSSLGKAIALALDEFYEIEDTSLFKDKIIELTLNMCELLIGLLAVESHNIDFIEYIAKHEKGIDDKETNEKISIILNNDKYLTSVRKRRLNKKPLIQTEMIAEMKTNLVHLENGIFDLAGEGEIKYLKVMFEEFFINKGKKLNKNDIIDSIYLKYYPTWQLITYDGDFLKRINKIDSNYYNSIMLILDKTRK